MKVTRAHRRHAVRVAAVATLIVMVGYVIAAVVINLIVTNHLVGTTDQRLHDRLTDASRQTLTLPGTRALGEQTDVDDAPVFLWSIAPSGEVTPLTPTAPPLPSRRWDEGPVTLSLGTSTFRFDTVQTHGTVLVAGQSTAETSHVQSVLLVAELVFGVILAVAVFVGATVVGLRASAPSELVRRRQAEFTADASHELRTPISVIEAEVGLALDRPRDPAGYREVLERVGRESTRLRRIVEDLLWLARADNEPVQAESTGITDVADVAERCAERFGAVAATHGVDLSVQRVGQGPFTVQAQPDLIDRLAGVLIDNGCKFAGEGGRVEVSVRGLGRSGRPASGRLGPRDPRRPARRRLRQIPPGHGLGDRNRVGAGHRRCGRALHPGQLGHRRGRSGRGTHGDLLAESAAPQGKAQPSG